MRLKKLLYLTHVHSEYGSSSLSFVRSRTGQHSVEDRVVSKTSVNDVTETADKVGDSLRLLGTRGARRDLRTSAYGKQRHNTTVYWYA
jgi:hypothetical protein